MEGDKFISTRESPRNFGLFNGVNKSMVGDVAFQKSAVAILDRFRAMVKDRDDEFRASGDDDPPPLSSQEVVQFYELMLLELAFNSKPIITDLTIIAGEQKEHGEGIAEAICMRILEAPPDQKLPALYLLDSITKNIGREYARHFSSRLPEVFYEAYRQVSPDMHPAIRHLFGTWSTVFPQSVLRKIETLLQFSSSGAHQPSNLTALKDPESPRPTHGIHVNPKYLEARHPFDPSNVDGNSKRASMSKFYGQKSAMEYDGYDSNIQLKVGAERSSAAKSVDRKRLSAAPEFGGPRSPLIDEFTINRSPKRVTNKRGLPHHPRYELGFGREIENEDLNVRPRDPISNNIYRRAESSAASNRTDDLDRPRALIDAYGRDQGEGTASNDRLKIARLDRNGLGRVTTETWQNTEEEEFDWENMSRTVADKNLLGGSSSSNLPSGRLGMRPGNQSAAQDGSHFSTENVVPSIPGISQMMGSRETTTQYLGSHYLPESQGHQIRSSVSGISSVSEPIRLIERMGAPSLDSQVTRNLAANMSWTPHSDMQKPHPAFASPAFQQQKHRDHFELTNNKDIGVNHLGMSRSFLLENQLDATSKSSTNRPAFPSQQVGYPPHSLHANPLNSHAMASQEVRQRLGHVPVPSMFPYNPLATLNPNLFKPPISRVLQGGNLPLLPQGPHHVSRQMVPMPQHLQGATNPPGGSLSGLFGSLMSQGLISLTNAPPVQDSMELSFNPDVLRMRHEAAITAMNFDLPRQCTTCGMRFKNQDEHSSHMDWHVTKNRMSRNRKQNLSRSWFVSANMWLTGAEALGTDGVPGFLPDDNTVEKKEASELVVPVDEDQKVCALCGEPFDDFYSDEAEEWMYKGAVYMNALTGSTEGLNRSQLGPIVHAKCMTESSTVSEENFGHGEGAKMRVMEGKD
ncbi:polyadenylation and cleavage factor homolog 4 [Impatiens glandulifera]|uniref:polyadenylation and cleavage factor homolog 4 n=1 Tax=Impatiens glandulifera TaxID=253017 RepID=UPI001FB109C6|nr:polyadenylation and cleavage factor homolog 4 [Impatiens glandulifera]